MKLGQSHREQRKILLAVALAYRRVMRAPEEPALTRGRRRAAGPKTSDRSATCGDRRISAGDKLAVSGEVNPMIAAAISADPQWFWHGPDA